MTREIGLTLLKLQILLIDGTSLEEILA